MNIEDFKYHNYPSSLVRRYGVYTLDDNKEGIDKYVFDLKKSYVHNYLFRETAGDCCECDP